MTILRNKRQTFLFETDDFTPRPQTWAILEFSQPDESAGAWKTSPAATALRQALENVSLRRDPVLHDCSFDIYAHDDWPCYRVAIPENLHPAVRGMVERKLLDVRHFNGMRRGACSLEKGYRPVAFYDAGAMWVLVTARTERFTAESQAASPRQLFFEFDECLQPERQTNAALAGV